MKLFEFKLISNCFEDANCDNHPGDDADFYIEEKDWNDYGYYTLYFIHATKRLTGSDNNQMISSIKIMKVGQKEYQKHLLREYFQNHTFQEMPEDFFSICFDKGFYDWMRQRSVEDRRMIAKQLHLMTSINDPYYVKVKDSECFYKGVLRDITIDNYVFQKSAQWMFDEICTYDMRKNPFKIHYTDCKVPVELNFTCVPNEDNPLVPNGIVALIGENGAGKSTALYRLAKLMYYYPQDREKLKDECGWLEPNDIGVDRMIIVSYSPFDNFQLPVAIHEGTNDAYLDTQEQEMRCIYCGIRDILQEFKYRQKENIGTLDSMKADRQKQTFIKTQEMLAADFASVAANVIHKNPTILSQWHEIAEKAREMHPVLSEHLFAIGILNKEQELAEYFMNLSTGYKYFVHSLAYIMNYIIEGTLVLFDEPENHIHPPLLSFLMATFREILSANKSVMLVSTHSPVVLQELFSDNVLKVKRIDNQLIVSKPVIETYGATFGEITEEVFGLTTDVTNYFNAFDHLFEKWGCSESDSVETMLTCFEEKLGHTISSQMASYLIEKYYSENTDND